MCSELLDSVSLITEQCGYHTHSVPPSQRISGEGACMLTCRPGHRLLILQSLRRG